MVITKILMIVAVFILGFLVDISINLRRLNGNVKKLIK